MDDAEKMSRLTGRWLYTVNRNISKDEAEAFIIMWNEMKVVDREEAEEQRVEHARDLSQRRSR